MGPRIMSVRLPRRGRMGTQHILSEYVQQAVSLAEARDSEG